MGRPKKEQQLVFNAARAIPDRRDRAEFLMAESAKHPEWGLHLKSFISYTHDLDRSWRNSKRGDEKIEVDFCLGRIHRFIIYLVYKHLSFGEVTLYFLKDLYQEYQGYYNRYFQKDSTPTFRPTNPLAGTEFAREVAKRIEVL